MADLIDRQAVIDALDKRFDDIPIEQTTEILLLRKDLRELPSAQHWIPVTERLPKDGESVIATTSWHAVTTAIFCGDCENRWEIDGCLYKVSAVIAWMPFPKPWKGEEDDGNQNER